MLWCQARCFTTQLYDSTRKRNLVSIRVMKTSKGVAMKHMTLFLSIAWLIISCNAGAKMLGADFDIVSDSAYMPDMNPEDIGFEDSVAELIASEDKDGQEICLPSCDNVECGDDGCGGSCGICIEGKVCEEGKCVPKRGCIVDSRPWSRGTKIFVEATEQWGLKEIGAEGIRISITDLDNDGFPDLIVRKSAEPSDFSEGKRNIWVLRNTGHKSFEDVTVSSGLMRSRLDPLSSKGRPGDIVVSADVDNDGDLDVYVGAPKQTPSSNQETSELMINDGTGRFDFGPSEMAIRFSNVISVPAGVSFVDYDRDGLVDLWITQNMPDNASEPLQDRLFRNKGNLVFEDVTYSAGLMTFMWFSIQYMNEGKCNSWAWSSLACDLNNDGIPELLAGSYGRFPNHLFRGEMVGDKVQYTNISVASGYAYDDRMDWRDNESARCYCKLHPDAPDCEDVPPPQYILCEDDSDVFRWNHEYDREPFRLGGNSATTVCADINNDGYFDLFTTEIVHWDVGKSSDPSEILVNTKDPQIRFVRPGNENTGILRDHPTPFWDDGDMTAWVFDFDNDGWNDIYLGSSDYPGTRGYLFHQDAPLKFSAVPTTDFFEHLRSHGVVAADFDRDGDIDIVVGHSRARCGGQYGNDCYPTQQIRLFENIYEKKGNFIGIKLEGGKETNRSAIGAVVEVSAGGITQKQAVDGGHGHYGTQKDMALVFGLGNECTAHVKVIWPDKQLTAQEFSLDAGSYWFIRQGEKPVRFTPGEKPWLGK